MGRLGRLGKLGKGEQTRAGIVDAALQIAAQQGLEGLTIGQLAEHRQMSKSGVFAHFGSREELQIMVLEAHEARFIADVLRPSLARPRGLERLAAIFEAWVARTVSTAPHGCIFISGAAEYDDRSGPVRDVLVRMVRGWQRELVRAVSQAIESHQLEASTDPEQVVFELHGIILTLHHDGRLLRSSGSAERAYRAFDRLMRSFAPEQVF
jgi:AcrR family transcriptional regulator